MFAYVMRLTLLKKTTQMGLAYAMRLVLFKENENISYHKRIGFWFKDRNKTMFVSSFIFPLF